MPFPSKKGQVHSIDSFLYGYIAFLFVFAMFLQLGLNSFLAASINIQPPQSPTFVVDCAAAGEGVIEFLVGFLCSAFAALSAAALEIIFFLQNIAFFINLMAINPSIGVIGLIIFGPAIAMILMWIVRMVRGN